MALLLIDDSRSFLLALSAILNEAGYKNLVTKASATEGIEYLRNINKNPGPDTVPVNLILMDLMMPGMDGLEAVKCIKNDAKLKDIPIIMVSSRDEEEKIQQAFEAGAIDYIGKPIRKLELCARVRSVLKLNEEREQRIAREKELEKTVERLQKAMEEIKTLNGLLPICAACKKIRDDKGYWQQVENYMCERMDVAFSHSLCPDCVQKLYPETAERLLLNKE